MQALLRFQFLDTIVLFCTGPVPLQVFSETTRSQVEEFLRYTGELWERFRTTGPGLPTIELPVGLTKLHEFQVGKSYLHCLFVGLTGNVDSHRASDVFVVVVVCMATCTGLGDCI